MVCRVTLMDDQIMKRSIHHQLGTLSPISASAQLAVVYLHFWEQYNYSAL